jgi:hypothetical protein
VDRQGLTKGEQLQRAQQLTLCHDTVPTEYANREDPGIGAGLPDETGDERAVTGVGLEVTDQGVRRARRIRWLRHKPEPLAQDRGVVLHMIRAQPWVFDHAAVEHRNERSPNGRPVEGIAVGRRLAHPVDRLTTTQSCHPISGESPGTVGVREGVAAHGVGVGERIAADARSGRGHHMLECHAGDLT